MPDRRLITVEELRAAIREGSQPDDVRLRAGFAAEVKAGDGDSREVQFTISTASVDRYGDTIAVEGWKLDAYRKNPVVLWAHDASELPVAKADKVWIEDGKLKAMATFVPRNVSRFADTVLELIKGGFLSATSVGFIPLKYAFVDDAERRYGIDFLEQELLEFSVVPVPANAEALIEGKSAGIDIAPIAEWAEKILGASGKSVVTQERLKRINDSEAAIRRRAKAAARRREIDVLRLRAG